MRKINQASPFAPRNTKYKGKGGERKGGKEEKKTPRKEFKKSLKKVKAHCVATLWEQATRRGDQDTACARKVWATYQAARTVPYGQTAQSSIRAQPAST